MSLKVEDTSHLTNSRRNRVGLTTSNRSARMLAIYWQVKIGKKRKRRLSVEQQEFAYNTTLCLCLDLLAASSPEATQWIGYSRGKKNYVAGGAYWDQARGHPYLSYTHFLNAIDYLQSEGWIESRKADAGHSKYSSRIRPTPKLLDEFKRRDLNSSIISEHPGTDTIVVKDANKKPIAWPREEGFPLVQALENLQCINSHLQSTLLNLNVPDDVLFGINQIETSIHENEDETSSRREKIDFTRRRLKRIFAQSSFNAGGRFYGGWWQNVPSEYRKYIEIDGAPTKELDFSTLQPRILYAEQGLEPPKDSYILPDWPEEFRPITKKAFSQLINSDESSRHPNQWHRFAPFLEPEPLPEDWLELSQHQQRLARRDFFKLKYGCDYSELISDLLEFHSAIETAFFSKAWARMQRLDSDIVERVLLKMLALDFPEVVLPIHDSFIVTFSAVDKLETAMQEAFQEIVGTHAVIDDEGSIFTPPDHYNGPLAEWLLAALSTAPNHQQTHKHYNKRNEEWVKIHRPQQAELAPHIVDFINKPDV